MKEAADLFYYQTSAKRVVMSVDVVATLTVWDLLVFGERLVLIDSCNVLFAPFVAGLTVESNSTPSTVLRSYELYSPQDFVSYY